MFRDGSTLSFAAEAACSESQIQSADSTTQTMPKILAPPRLTKAPHQKRLNGLQIHPTDNSRIVSLGNDGLVVSWNWNSAAVDWSQPNALPAWSGAFSNDGNFLAIGRRSGVQLLNPRNGELIREVSPARGAVSLAFSGDGRLLAGMVPTAVTNAWPHEPHLSIWTSETGKLLHDIALGHLFVTTSRIVFSEDSTLAYLATSKAISIIDVLKGRVIRKMDFGDSIPDLTIIQIDYADPLPWAIGHGLAGKCSYLTLINLESGKLHSILTTSLHIDRVGFNADKSGVMVLSEGMLYEINLTNAQFERIFALDEYDPTGLALPFRAPRAPRFDAAFDIVRFDTRSQLMIAPLRGTGNIATWKLD